MSATEQRTEKACTKCGVVKPLDQFYGNGPGRHSRRADCKACFRTARSRTDAAYVEASRVLRQRHPNEFQALYVVAMQASQ